MNFNFNQEPLGQDAETTAAICDLIGESLDIKDVIADEDFFDLGGTSLLGATLIVQIEQRLGARLSLADLYENPTASKLATRLKRDRPSTTDSFSAMWLPSTHSGASEKPVFLVHNIPPDLCRATRRRRPVIGLSYGVAGGGDDTGWPPPTGVEAWAAHYIAEIRRVHPSGPYHLVGYSRGGVIAWEMARQLLESGVEVGILCLVDARPPPWVVHGRVGWRTRLRRTSAMPPGLLAVKALRFARNRLSKVLQRLQEQWKRSDQPSGLELLQMDAYRMRALPRQPLLIEATKPQIMNTLSEVIPMGPAYEIAGLTPGGQVLVQIPGDHYSIVQYPLAEQVAAAIEDAMQAYESKK